MRSNVLWINDKGRPVIVSDGIGRGESYGAFYVKDNGALERVKGVEMRATPSRAMVALEQYADVHGWEVAEDPGISVGMMSPHQRLAREFGRLPRHVAAYELVCLVQLFRLVHKVDSGRIHGENDDGNLVVAFAAGDAAAFLSEATDGLNLVPSSSASSAPSAVNKQPEDA